MKSNRIIRQHKAGTFLFALVLCWSVMASKTWASPDAYVVYHGKDKEELQIFLAALPKEFSVKPYNVDRLRIGDYSEKQKALTKFENALVIVFLLDEPMKIFSGSKVRRDLIIVESVMTTVESEARTLYVLSQDMDSAQLEHQLKILRRTADVVRVKEKTLYVMAAASFVTARTLTRE